MRVLLGRYCQFHQRTDQVRFHNNSFFDQMACHSRVFWYDFSEELAVVVFVFVAGGGVAGIVVAGMVSVVGIVAAADVVDRATVTAWLATGCSGFGFVLPGPGCRVAEDRAMMMMMMWLWLWAECKPCAFRNWYDKWPGETGHVRRVPDLHFHAAGEVHREKGSSWSHAFAESVRVFRTGPPSRWWWKVVGLLPWCAVFLVRVFQRKTLPDVDDVAVVAVVEMHFYYTASVERLIRISWVHSFRQRDLPEEASMLYSMSRYPNRLCH